jgi:cobalt/nickel transport system permease protein
VIAVSIALVIQALVFGDGGITAIGANCFNMAFAEVLAGYAIFRLIAGRKKDTTSTQGKRFLMGAAVGSYVGINLAAFLTAFELGIQTILHVGSDGRPLYSPFPLKLTIPAIMIEHLVLFGVVEAVVTVMVLLYLRKAHPDLLRRES